MKRSAPISVQDQTGHCFTELLATIQHAWLVLRGRITRDFRAVKMTGGGKNNTRPGMD